MADCKEYRLVGFIFDPQFVTHLIENERKLFYNTVIMINTMVFLFEKLIAFGFGRLLPVITPVVPVQTHAPFLRFYFLLDLHVMIDIDKLLDILLDFLSLWSLVV